ncbi:hypothetical protein BDY19DRAFT_64847 [Irpex rosettiformis]|uniref:Uncharacterized protein n=1 Tax=Irpex rosettiformis TaxID=378272 RepID=A0ACB8UKU5_9APHY|nr:hypothetical protein BDY19DRAFT_64847 [Irpex rosettiformis]
MGIMLASSMRAFMGPARALFHSILTSSFTAHARGYTVARFYNTTGTVSSLCGPLSDKAQKLPGLGAKRALACPAETHHSLSTCFPASSNY